MNCSEYALLSFLWQSWLKITEEKKKFPQQPFCETQFAKGIDVVRSGCATNGIQPRICFNISCIQTQEVIVRAESSRSGTPVFKSNKMYQKREKEEKKKNEGKKKYEQTTPCKTRGGHLTYPYSTTKHIDTITTLSHSFHVLPANILFYMYCIYLFAFHQLLFIHLSCASCYAVLAY